MNKQIQKSFTSPPHRIAFSTPNRVKKYYKNATVKEVNNALAGLDSFTRHREYKAPRTRNPFYIYFKRQQIQMDLIDVRHLKKRNNGKYILTAIDCYTKFCWIRLLPNKTADATLIGIKSILAEMGQPPVSIFFDRGTEVKNRKVQTFLKSKNIKLMHPNSELKAAIVERFNKTLQSLIYKYMTEHQTLKYADKLQDLVAIYNNRLHRTIKMTPADAELEKNQLLVRNALNEHYSKIERKRKKKPKFEIGDIVRIKTLDNVFARSYNEQFSRELFEIVEILTRMPITQYIVKSLDDGEEVSGGFYDEELTKVINDGVYKVERVLRSRLREGRKEYLIKWIGFSKHHNSWEPAENIVQEYQQ